MRTRPKRDTGGKAHKLHKFDAHKAAQGSGVAIGRALGPGASRQMSPMGADPHAAGASVEALGSGLQFPGLRMAERLKRPRHAAHGRGSETVLEPSEPGR